MGRAPAFLLVYSVLKLLYASCFFLISALVKFMTTVVGVKQAICRSGLMETELGECTCSLVSLYYEVFVCKKEKSMLVSFTVNSGHKFLEDDETGNFWGSVE